MKVFFDFFVKRHTFANILTAMVILLGLAVLPSINRDTFPDVDLDEVVIITQYQGASPEDIELKITNKIEDKLKSIDGIKRFTSVSIENNSLIDIFIESDASDPEKIKDDIREKIDLINDFPSDLQKRPTVTEILSSSFPILEVGISAEDLTYDELRAIAKEFKKELEEIKGVSSIEGYGYLSKEMKIKPIPSLLDRYQVSLIDIVQTISNQNRRSSMGNFVQNSAQSTIVNDSRLFTVEDVESAII
ncbi:MAG: efflux RND transporter permease subunit, partial [Candidatus Margulisiibacteriota bacterium]|nr:efflux RND transporter permease subunit [Candidatus Margulisiibacteriota bacterium]